MPVRDPNEVQFKACGHWTTITGAVHVLGSGLGKLEQFCDRCGEWRVLPPKRKPKKPKVDPNAKPLF